jgi:hypothetical protein
MLICMDRSMLAANGINVICSGAGFVYGEKQRLILLYATAAVLQTPGLLRVSRSGPCFSPVLSGGEVRRRLG